MLQYLYKLPAIVVVTLPDSATFLLTVIFLAGASRVFAFQLGPVLEIGFFVKKLL